MREAELEQRVRLIAAQLRRAKDQPTAQRITAQLDAQDFDPRGRFVYLQWSKDDSRPLYVGQSTNVLVCLGQHLAKAYGRRVERVSLISCKDRQHMVRTERRLIRHYHPVLNISLNGMERMMKGDEDNLALSDTDRGLFRPPR